MTPLPRYAQKLANTLMRQFRLEAPLIAVFIASCLSADSPSPPTSPPARPPSPPPAVNALILNVDTAGAVAGTRLRVRVQAFDPESRRIETLAAVVTSSNPSVATPGNREVVNTKYPSGWILELYQELELLAGGTATIRATLRERTESTTVHVQALSPSTAALVVDSFTVIEWGAASYLAYSPLLRLRERTGSSFADVIAVEFILRGTSTGWCSPGPMRYANGMSEHILTIDRYLWSNDVMFVSLDGSSLPGPGKVRVIMQDSDGQYGLVEAVAPVQRGVVSPPTFFVPWHSGWQCGVSPPFVP